MNNQEENKQDSTEFNKLDDLDNSILTLKLKGMKIVDIADELGKNRNTIENRIKKEHFQSALKEHQQTALDILLEAQTGAAKALQEIVNNKEEKTSDRVNAAKEILKGVLSEKIDLKGDMNVNVTIKGK